MTIALGTRLTQERVRGDLDVLSRAGLDQDTFLAEATASVARAVPWVAACVGTHDPSTRMLTGARKYGDLHGRDDQDVAFGILEYDSPETTAYRHLVDSQVTALAMKEHTQGDVARSERMSRLMQPVFDYHDELRLVFYDAGRFWGGMALFRGLDDTSFTPEDVAFLSGLSGHFARGVRTGILARMAREAPAPPAPTVLLPGVGGDLVPVPAGPAVLVVGSDDEVLQSSPAALAWLDRLGAGPHMSTPLGVVSALVGAARRLARGDAHAVPRTRVRAGDGTWLVLHASPLSQVAHDDGRAGEVVVTIEEARPPEIVSLVVAAFDLTARERDVTQLVLQGVDTKEIARGLHLSPYTVQDHLKSIFDKAGVRSRRELIAKVFFDQYGPRMGAEVGPSGWFRPA